PSSFFLIPRPPLRSPLFPYTTLFRSLLRALRGGRRRIERKRLRAAQAPGRAHHGRRGPAGEVAIRKAQPQGRDGAAEALRTGPVDRKSTRLNSSHVAISYAVFCLKKK